MSYRARCVLAYIAAAEKHPWLLEHFEDVIVDPKLPPVLVIQLRPKAPA